MSRKLEVDHAFQGLKVLDFCWVAIGPLITRYLADFGATVLRVESRTRLETLRIAQPFKDGVAGVNRSGYFSALNMGKLGLAINMSQKGSFDLIKKLVSWADIVTENFTPGTMDRWGLGYEQLKNINPNVILFSASMLGYGGPHSKQPGFGPVLTSLAGLSNLTGWPDMAPTPPYGAYTDFLLPHLGVSAIVAALDYRQRTGYGLHIDLSQLEGSLQYIAPTLLDYQLNGHIQERAGNTDDEMAPHGVYPCLGEDRWCAIACETDAQWGQLCVAMGKPELATDQRYSTLEVRKKNEAELDSLVKAWTSENDAYSIMRNCQDLGVAAGVVQDCRDLFGDPQLRYREHFVFTDHPEIGPHAIDGNCFLLSESGAQYQRPAPLLGQHTHQICQEILGLSNEEIARLEEWGILE